ncbi:MAG: isochorismatase family protein [Spirochaetales bacterium]|nr:isochorismatase family protein [Spirochaetales bacterium]
MEESAVLTFIDVQGKLSDLMDNREDLFNRLLTLIRGFQALEIPILWLEQLPEKLGATRPELAAELQKTGRPLAKTSFSALGCEAYRRALEQTGARRVYLCGIEAHICVYQTARDLLAQNYRLTLLADCVSSRRAADRETAIAAIRDLGGRILGLEGALFEILGDPGHPAFREISRLIKPLA